MRQLSCRLPFLRPCIKLQDAHPAGFPENANRILRVTAAPHVQSSRRGRAERGKRQAEAFPRRKLRLPSASTRQWRRRKESEASVSSLLAGLTFREAPLCPASTKFQQTGERVRARHTGLARTVLRSSNSGQISVHDVRAAVTPGFGIKTRRTGAGRYVFSCSVLLSPVSHSSPPADSMSSNVCLSTPETPRTAGAWVGVGQHVFAIHPVVQEVKAGRGLPLRLHIQRPLKPPNRVRKFAGSRQSPCPWLRLTHPEVRLLPSTGISGFVGTVSLSDSRPDAARSRRAGRDLWVSHVFAEGLAYVPFPLTPVDRKRCMCRSFPLAPSPALSWRTE